MKNFGKIFDRNNSEQMFNNIMNLKFKFLLLLSFFISFQISALTEMDSKIICKDSFDREDIVFERKYETHIVMTNEENETEGLYIVRIDEDYIIAEDYLVDVNGLRMIMYVFLKNESNDITKVKRRFFKNPKLLGNDNTDLRISISLKDSKDFVYCLKA